MKKTSSSVSENNRSTINPASRILIVDDEPVNVQMICRYLQKLGYSTFTAQNGQEALEELEQCAPDLVLLDIAMPVLDGLSVCQRLRKDVRTRGLPIILLTAKASPEDRLRGFQIGADDYVTKPFDLEELHVRIEGALQRRRWNLWSHPLTQLPGSPAIEEEVRKRLSSGIPFAFAYIDIDNFKAYNDAYGYEAGDRVIKTVSTLLIEAAITPRGQTAFPGHVGGDDFVLIAPIEHMKEVLPLMADHFDGERHHFYRLTDWERGMIQTTNRLGEPQNFPLMTLTVAAVSTLTREVHHYARLVEIASELKQYLKTQDHQAKSLFLWDRRADRDISGPIASTPPPPIEKKEQIHGSK